MSQDSAGLAIRNCGNDDPGSKKPLQQAAGDQIVSYAACDDVPPRCTNPMLQQRTPKRTVPETASTT